MNSRFVTVKVREVRVGDRIRKFPGDLTALRESMQRVGLLNPIVIDPNHNLVAGYRRLTVARTLGWETIEARITPFFDKRVLLAMEMEENTTRRDFSPEQLAKGEKLMDRYSKNSAGWKLVNWLIG
jgi:ParB family transcriptional regulator, chromosome partitioning protein